MKYGILGVGNMGRGMLSAILHSGLHDAVHVFNTSSDNLTLACKMATPQTRVEVAKNAEELVHKSDIVIIATKPRDIGSTLDKIRDALKGKALISVAAGVKYADFSALLDSSTRVLTCLPNLPISVQCGVVGIAKGYTLTQDEYTNFVDTFKKSALLVALEESQLGVLSAVSGSGPAFTALYIDALAKAGVSCGLDTEIATKIAVQTVLGTSTLLEDTKKDPATLAREVCSPGGTSIEGVKVLQNATPSLDALVQNAIDATVRRWDELV